MNATVIRPLRERVSSHPQRIRRSAIQPPNRLADAPDEVRKGSVQTRLQNRQMPDRYKVVGKPGDAAGTSNNQNRKSPDKFQSGCGCEDA